MYILTNKDDVIIAICEVLKPCRQHKGQTILCKDAEAQGYVSADGESVYAKMGEQFQPSFDDIANVYATDDIPEEVEPLKYLYDGEAFIINEEPYPESNVKLTAETKVNSEDVDTCLQAVAELYEMIGGTV